MEPLSQYGASPLTPGGEDVSAPTRLRLQQDASDNLRRNVLRGVRRWLVLVGADLAAFGSLAALAWGVRDRALLGARGSQWLHVLAPGGATIGWEFTVALVLALAVTGNYGQGYERRNPGRLFLGCALGTALPLWSAIWTRGIDVVIAEYSFATVLLWAGLLADRLTLDRVVARVARPEQNAARTLFVGAAADCRDALRNPALGLASGHRSVGFVDLHGPPAPDALGHIDQFAVLLRRTRAEAVVLSGHLPPARIHQIVDPAQAAGCELLVVPRVLEVAGVQPTLLRRNGQVLIRLMTPRLEGAKQFTKRTLDLVVASTGLVLLSPAFLLVALLVKLDSPGPVFFRQLRVGRGGRLFPIVKFRTMRHGADAQRDGLLKQNMYADGRLFKMRGDPRVTRVGRRLRPLSLDELPQLFNVLRGEMSLVGPRPPLPSEVELYEVHHYARFDVKPGMTGPWQVSGRNDITDFEHVLTLEKAYIREWSLAHDLRILLKTVPVVLARRGAH